MGLFNDGYVIELHDNDHGLMMMVMLFMGFADLFSQLIFWVLRQIRSRYSSNWAKVRNHQPFDVVMVYSMVDTIRNYIYIYYIHFIFIFMIIIIIVY